MSLNNLPKLIFLNDNHGGYLNHTIEQNLLEPFPIKNIQDSNLKFSIQNPEILIQDMQVYLDELREESFDSQLIFHFDIFTSDLNSLNGNISNSEKMQKDIIAVIESYFNFINIIKSLGFQNLSILSPVPINFACTNVENPQAANMLLKFLNNVLKEKCLDEGVQFINVFNKFINSKNQKLNKQFITKKSNGELNIKNTAIVLGKEIQQIFFYRLKPMLKPPIQLVATHETFIKKLITPSHLLNEDQYLKINRGDVVDFTVIKEHKGSFCLNKAIINGELLDSSYRFAFVKHFVTME